MEFISIILACIYAKNIKLWNSKAQGMLCLAVQNFPPSEKSRFKVHDRINAVFKAFSFLFFLMGVKCSINLNDSWFLYDPMMNYLLNLLCLENSFEIKNFKTLLQQKLNLFLWNFMHNCTFFTRKIKGKEKLFFRGVSKSSIGVWERLL